MKPSPVWSKLSALKSSIATDVRTGAHVALELAVC